MRKLLLAVSALFICNSLLAQEKEINAALSAFEKNNSALAKAELAKVESLVNENSKIISPSVLAKYYYVKGELALSGGDVEKAAEAFKNLHDYENGTIYSARNKSTKKTEYYKSKAEGSAAVASGNYSSLKEETLTPDLILKSQNKISELAQNKLEAGSKAYEEKNYIEAAKNFMATGHLVEAMGVNGDLYIYNGAISYHLGNQPEKALVHYKELINSGYTGVRTTYEGVYKESGEVAVFQNKTDADAQARLGLVTNVKEVKTPSVEKELYANTLRALYAAETYDPVVKTIATKYPNDAEISSLVASIYHLSGNQDEFIKQLQENIKIDPKNADNYYNLGVLTMDSDEAQSKKYFEKALELNPEYKNAYINLAALELRPAKEYVETINSNLGTSQKEKNIYKEFTTKLKEVYTNTIPYLEKAYELDKTDADTVKLLREAYKATNQYDKEDEFLEIERNLRQLK